MSDTLLLRAKPTTVEARQLDEDNQIELARWAGGWTYGTRCIRWFGRTGQVQEAGPGDWVVRNACGEYVRVPDSQIFALYDRIGAEQ